MKIILPEMDLQKQEKHKDQIKPIVRTTKDIKSYLAIDEPNAVKNIWWTKGKRKK